MKDNWLHSKVTLRLWHLVVIAALIAIVYVLTNPPPVGKVCCHTFGYGAFMARCCDTYAWIDQGTCIYPQDYVGGGAEIAPNAYCMIHII